MHEKSSQILTQFYKETPDWAISVASLVTFEIGIAYSLFP